MENMTVTSKVFEKKTDSYNTNMNDFVAESELTVTITLGEYRDLVASAANKKYEIDKANADKYERQKQAEKLTAENNELKAENYELKKQVDMLAVKSAEAARMEGVPDEIN